MEGNVDEYPKKMRRTDGEVVTVLAAPDNCREFVHDPEATDD